MNIINKRKSSQAASPAPLGTAAPRPRVPVNIDYFLKSWSYIKVEFKKPLDKNSTIWYYAI